MSVTPVIRSQYWNPSTGTVRALHAWGVADGLVVSAQTGAGGVTVGPGVGLDAAGRTIVLAAGGVAVIDPAARVRRDD